MADPVTDAAAEHDAWYGEEGAKPPEWLWVRDHLARARVAWFTTTRPEGGPRTGTDEDAGVGATTSGPPLK